MNNNLTTLAEDFTAWSLPTFAEAHAVTSLAKLGDEVSEVIQAVVTGRADEEVAEEMADVMMCVFDAAARMDITPAMLTSAFAAKLKKNKARTWKRNDNGTYSHVKS
jgi:NTP pyrophosphatase (non-canonical NTP hydrolase)